MLYISTTSICLNLLLFSLFYQDDPSKAEMSEKMEAALQFPTGADLKDLEEVEGDFSGKVPLL